MRAPLRKLMELMDLNRIILCRIFFKAAVSMTSAYWRGKCTWSFIRSSNLCCFPRRRSTASFTPTPGSALKVIPQDHEIWEQSYRSRLHSPGKLSGGSHHTPCCPWALVLLLRILIPWASTRFSLVVLAFRFQLRSPHWGRLPNAPLSQKTHSHAGLCFMFFSSLIRIWNNFALSPLLSR